VQKISNISDMVVSIFAPVGIVLIGITMIDDSEKKTSITKDKLTKND